MTWPFENDTDVIVKKLAKRSLAVERRRNLMVVTAVALPASLVRPCGRILSAGTGTFKTGI